MTTRIKLPYFQVDAFTSHVFSGNPAGVCPLDRWPDDSVLQSVAAENNLSETAFFVKRDHFYELRWFTPTMEVDLCGHATLATAFIVFNYLETSLDSVHFETKSGRLTVKKSDNLLMMDFPSRPGQPAGVPESLIMGLGGIRPQEVLKSRDYLVILDSETRVRKISPEFAELAKLDCLCIIVSAKGDEVDFVSRVFGPRAGINEDPVTGSAHCTLIPYWSEKLGKTEMTALQVSQRGGELYCRHQGDRVSIAGSCALYLEGQIFIEV